MQTPAPLLRFDRLRTYFRNGLAPLRREGDSVIFLTTKSVASPNDERVSEAAFSARLRAEFAAQLEYEATNGLADRDPRASAKNILSFSGVPAIAPALALISSALLAAPQLIVASMIIASTALFTLIVAIRIGLAMRSLLTTDDHIDSGLSDDNLPVVTILAPLFHEAHALPGLARAIDTLAYPPSKIDVKLLLEECDHETLLEAFRLKLDERFDIVVVPASSPQTKPKACNYGLQCARGDLIVIYDAEDEPEPNQLRKAAAMFAREDSQLACVQARLNFYNCDENWLTRLFALEYCLWFDHFLPALDRLGAPVPLGGTSNVFRTDILVAAGGWDPYNVTEDADLGLRLAERGYRTAIIDSTTYEEANCRVGNWMRQRSRWMKGFMQTWLVRRRGRFPGLADWRSFVTTDLFIGGTAFAALISPVLWMIVAAEAAFGVPVLDIMPAPLRSVHLAALAGGNLALLALAAVAPRRRGLGHLAFSALLTPFYWLMMSGAAWIALYQLATRPYFWEKTEHGLSGEAKARRAAALRSFGVELDCEAERVATDADEEVGLVKANGKMTVE